MYEEFYDLKERPFNILADPSYLYLSRQHRLALAHLEYGLVNRAGFIVITGEIGTGKTTLLKSLLEHLEQNTVVASIFNTTVPAQDFLPMIMREFEIAPQKADQAENIELLNQFLIEQYANGSRTVLIIDEAQNLSLEVLEEVRLLSNLQTEKDPLLQIILVGQPELKYKLGNPSLRQLAQRISVYYHLNPLDEKETKAYIIHRLKTAGAKHKIFEQDALSTIYKHTQGVPRLINLLCDACLVSGFADSKKTITKEDVEEVVSGQAGMDFWRLASGKIEADSTESTESNRKSELSASQHNNNGLKKQISKIENQVAELKQGYISLSQLVNQYLLSTNESRAEKELEQAIEKLSVLLEEEKRARRQLQLEKEQLLQRISELESVKCDKKEGAPEFEIKPRKKTKKDKVSWWKDLF